MKNCSKIEEKIEKIISSMTVREKIGQLNQIPFDDIHNEGIEERIEKGEIGALILSWGAYAGNEGQEAINIDRLNELQRIAVEKSSSKVPLLLGRDVIHGHHTVFPIPLAMAASFNPELVAKSYSYIAKEATSEGIKWTFTPMLDLARDPRWGRIVEGCGEDPYLGGIMAKAIINGLQGDDYSKKDKMAACAKHYIGYGASEGGRDYHKTEISDYTLRNFYLPAFKSAVDNNVATVMSSFNEISGQPVTSSEYLLKDVLKTELGFEGFVVSDYGAVEQVEMQGIAENREQSAELCINAGLDMDMGVECYWENLEKLVNDGKVKMNVLDEAVRRILRIKGRCGLLDDPYVEKVTVDRTEHLALSREMAGESLVLLKNENNILPLSKSGKYGIAGPMAKNKESHFGAWVIDGKYDEIVSVEEEIYKKVTDKKNIVSAQSDMITDVLEKMFNVETVIVVCGESKSVTGEFRSLSRIEMPQEQVELLKRLKAMGKKVIAVMCFGRPVAMEEAEPYCDAVLYAWHSGTMAGAAIADVLFGDVCPSGKLPVTMPRSTGQIPIYYNVPSSGRPVNGYYEELLNYVDLKSTPMYRFGYGLSYTEFEYSNAEANVSEISLSDINRGEKITVKAQVINVGGYGAKAVVQCYICDKIANLTRPIRELKGFKKVYIEKNEKMTVEFQIGKEELGYYNRNGIFEVEKGKFNVYVGSDCYANAFCTIEVI